MKMNRCGVVSIIGRPNTGKSTLLNYILGEKVTIVSNIPQTTRNIIRGIFTEDRGQIVFIDTPGIHKPKHQLGKYMNITASEVISGADVVLHIADSSEPPGEEENMVVERIKHSKSRVILALNKIDLGGKFIDGYLKLWEEKKSKPLSELTDFLFPIPVSALYGTNIDKLLEVLFSFFPERENLYPADTVSDFPRKLFFADIIREKIFKYAREEVPHSIAVLVEEIAERSEKLVYIRARILVERASQKGIIIGNGGKALKEAGTSSRREIEELLGERVYLDLNVKVKAGWKNDPEMLKQLGYFS